MSKTFLEIVNAALAECKVSLDPLTAVDFDNPPRTGLYNHFKRWANSVYKELMIERPQWFFRNERTTIELQPRLHLSGLTYVPSIGDVLVGQNSGTKFTVTGLHTFEDNEDNPTVEYTVDVEYDTGSSPHNFYVNETLDRESPIAATAVGYVAHTGRYNFADDVIGLDELDMTSARAFYGEENNNGYPVIPIPWTNWINRYEYYPYGLSAHPEYITRTSDGNYELFPAPTFPFYLGFNYSRTYNDMVAYDDTPVGVPDQYQDMLVWLVVAEYADFDNNTRLYSRAAKKLAKYDYYIARDELPQLSFAPSKFSTHTW